jgi:lactoylglutathione lyase
MKTKINHIHLRCRDYHKTARWFIDTLGAEDLDEGDLLGWPIHRIDLGGLILAVSPPKEGLEVEKDSGLPRHGLYQLGYAIPDMDEALSELMAKGAEITAGPITPRPGLTVAFVKAPDNIEIELMQID